MRISESLHPMMMLDIDDEDKISITFRTPSPQMYKSIQEKGSEKELELLMSRLGDSLEARLAHMESMIPKNQIARRANA